MQGGGETRALKETGKHPHMEDTAQRRRRATIATLDVSPTLSSEEALNEHMTRYYPRVERIVRARMGGFLRSRMEVDDVLQQVIVRAARDM